MKHYLVLYLCLMLLPFVGSVLATDALDASFITCWIYVLIMGLWCICDCLENVSCPRMTAVNYLGLRSFLGDVFEIRSSSVHILWCLLGYLRWLGQDMHILVLICPDKFLICQDKALICHDRLKSIMTNYYVAHVTRRAGKWNLKTICQNRF